MKAIRQTKPWAVSRADIEKPTPREGGALIRIAAAGIRSSEIGAFRGTNGLVSDPRVIGHGPADILEQVKWITKAAAGK